MRTSQVYGHHDKMARAKTHRTSLNTEYTKTQQTFRNNYFFVFFGFVWVFCLGLISNISWNNILSIICVCVSTNEVLTWGHHSERDVVVAVLRPPSPSERRARGSHVSHIASSPPGPPPSRRHARAPALTAELKSQSSTGNLKAKYKSLFLTFILMVLLKSAINSVL